MGYVAAVLQPPAKVEAGNGKVEAGVSEGYVFLRSRGRDDRLVRFECFSEVGDDSGGFVGQAVRGGGAARGVEVEMRRGDVPAEETGGVGACMEGWMIESALFRT